MKRRAEAVNDVWCWDFIFDTTEDGKSIKILSMVDEYSRFCIALDVDRKINGSTCLMPLSPPPGRGRGKTWMKHPENRPSLTRATSTEAISGNLRG